MEPTFSLDRECFIRKLNHKILERCQPFTCGDEELDNFFANDALAYNTELMGNTYCWILKDDDTKIVGMFTLSNTGLQTTHLNNHPRRKLNNHIAFKKRGRTYPAVLIGRLGVNQEFQGKQYRIGAQIMAFIKRWLSDEDSKAACRFLAVDSLNTPHAIQFYERNGFTPLFPRENDEKEFYRISADEQLRTRMYFFDLYM
jgi:GNAT superfamily N-acetyltransferase